jgi:hypothetical protein
MASTITLRSTWVRVEQYNKKLDEQALVATMYNDAYDTKRRP